MKLPTLSSDPTRMIGDLGAAVSDYLTPTLRLGVTGLSRSGKTVFITSLVRTLKDGGADPAFRRLAGIDGFRAYLEPQPDDDVPRFAYEEHLAALTASPPHWPESTRRISQLRLTFEWTPEDAFSRTLGLGQRLHIDIIDYPGEWLIDLGLLDLDYHAWSRDAVFVARGEGLAPHSRDFLAFLDTVEAGGPADEQVAIEGAKIYTDYITTARQADPSRAALGPGRFLLPGDLEGSPQLTFFPLALPAEAGPAPGGQTLHAMLARRYEKYKQNVVRPFFEKHFSRLDRQIVLIDALTALNGGAEALANLEQGLDGVMKAFRPGRNSWLSFILRRRIDRILFAATKADHIHHTSHRRLEAVLQKAVSRAAQRAEQAGADFRCVALAALRATEDVDRAAGEETYHCIRGIPVDGETVNGRRFDGATPAVVFPGDLPRDPLDAFDAEKATPEDYSFVRFRPPPLSGDAGRSGAPMRWPHIGLGRTIAYLFGDRLP